MDTIVLWVALIGVIGTLGGVCLGNWLQSRNIKRQREWMLQDQRREWVRKRKIEDFGSILAYVESTINYLALIGDTLASISSAKQEELVLEFEKRLASVVPTMEVVKAEDKELSDLVDKFLQEKNKVFNTVMATKDASKGNADNVIKLAGQIKSRINELLEETFD